MSFDYTPEARELVTITRYWHAPQIHLKVTDEKIGLDLPLEDFLKALKQEIGSVKLILRQATWDQQFDEAWRRTVEKVKEESVKIM